MMKKMTGTNEVATCLNCKYEERKRKAAEQDIKELKAQVADVIRFKDGMIEIAEAEARKYYGIIEGFNLFLVDVEEI